MRLHYLEIVSADVDAVVAAYRAAHGVEFAAAEPLLGGARVATLADGARVGIRPPLRPDEAPVVRPYWRVGDLTTAVAAATARGARVALERMEIPGKGVLAICIEGGVDHGLWQVE